MARTRTLGDPAAAPKTAQAAAAPAPTPFLLLLSLGVVAVLLFILFTGQGSALEAQLAVAGTSHAASAVCASAAPCAACAPQVAAPAFSAPSAAAAAPTASASGDTLVLVVTTADTPPSTMRRDNLNFFLRQALLPRDASVHIVVIVQGAWPEVRGALDGAEAWVAAHGKNNFHVVWHVNEGFDFGAWKLALNGSLPLGGGRKASDFAFFVLLNGSAKGPLLPAWWADERDAGTRAPFPAWPALFTNVLRGSVRLVGTSVNCEQDHARTHLQSMTLAFGARDLAFIAERIVWGTDKNDGSMANEFGISQAILRDGGNLGALQLAFRGHNFADGPATRALCATEGLGSEDRFYPPDVYKGGPGGITFNPLELVFFKANRNVMQPYVDAYARWQLRTRASEVPEVALVQPAQGPEPTLVRT